MPVWYGAHVKRTQRQRLESGPAGSTHPPADASAPEPAEADTTEEHSNLAEHDPLFSDANDGGVEPGAERVDALSPWRSRLLGAVLFASAAVFLRVVHAHLPLGSWFTRRVALYLLLSALFSAACLSAGHAVVRRLRCVPMPLGEHVAVSFAVGLYAFFVGALVLGLLGLYGPVFFVAYPLALLALGAPSWLPTARRLARGLLRARSTSRGRAPSLVAWLAASLGVVGFALVYIPALVPDNAAFDARWYHLTIAQQYAVAGGVTRFPEGWYPGAIPHLASVLYAWAWMMPGADLYDRVVLSAHVELATFVFTLAALPALVRTLVPGTRVPHAASALFLFPGVLLYDSAPSLGADHVAAAFAVPVFTLTLRFVRVFEVRLGALLGIVVSGAFLTKYTGALAMLAFPVVAVLATLALRAARDWRAGTHDLVRLRAAGALGLVALLATAPQWVKNWVWYGDPLYPLLHAGLSPRPWTGDSAERLGHFVEAEFWHPTRDLAGLWETLKAQLSFSFQPHDWATFHGKMPVFGSLFSLLVFALPLLRGTARIWALYGATHLGLFVWFSTHHQDRYLQAILPWMAGATAAVLVLVWRVSWVARAGAAALVGAQLAWATHVPFIPAHAMLESKSPFRAALDLAEGVYQRKPTLVGPLYAAMETAGRMVPPNGVVLLHDFKLATGLGRRVVNDNPHSQGGISYGELGSSRAVHEHLRSLGVTHVLWSRQAVGLDSLAGDLVMHRYLAKHAGMPKSVGYGLSLATLPAEPPPDDGDTQVLVLLCDGRFEPGLYSLASLHVPPWRKSVVAKPLAPASATSVPSDVDLAIIDRACHRTAPAGFSVMATRKRSRIDVLVRAGRVLPEGDAPALGDGDAASDP